MALPARNDGVTRRSWLLLAGVGISLFRLRAKEALEVTFDGDNLHVAAPGLHFLTGDVLKRLKDGDQVIFLSKITLFSDSQGTVFRKPVQERLLVSYDIWSEEFAAAIPGGPVPRASGLTASQTEEWCLENLAISALGLDPGMPFWLKFELRTVSRRDTSKVMNETGISLRNVIDYLAQHPAPNEPSWTLSAGPLRLSGLARTPGRGTRIG